MLANFSNLITFSRGSNATVTDASGRLTYAASNILTNSQDFESANWTKNGVTVAANAVAAPDGTLTADTAIADAILATHRVSQTPTVANGVQYIASIYVKAAGYSKVAIREGNISGAYAAFDLSTGALLEQGSGGTGTISNVGNGWYRISMRSTSGGTAMRIDLIIVDPAYTTGAPNLGWTGNGTSGIYFWGAQLEAVTYQTTPSPYVSTSVANLLGFSEAFDNAAWTKSNSSIVPNAAQNPINNLWNAQKLMENTAASNHYAGQSVSVVSGVSYTLSFYAKQSGRNAVFEFASSGFGASKQAVFNLSTGTATPNAGVTASIVDVGNGWYRCSATCTATATTTAAIYCIMASGTTQSYTGDGNSGIYIYGAQLSNSGSLDPYVPTPGAAPSSTAYYGPRFDYDPVTLAAKGILIEEQRTNLLRYSEQLDNGSAWTNVAGATVTANTFAAPDGTTTADTVNFSTTNANRVEQSFGTAVNGETMTFSVYLRGSGSMAINIGTDTGVGGNSEVIVNLTSTWTRYSATVTYSSPTGLRRAMLIWRTGNTATSAQAWGAQVEAGAFATSYIPTVASQVTRSADVASITGSLFSQWYRQDEGTFVVEYSRFQNVQFGVAVETKELGSGTTANRLLVSTTSAADPRFQNFIGGSGVLDTSGTFGVLAANTVVKTAIAYKSGDNAATRNGASPATSATAFATQSYTNLQIGQTNNTVYGGVPPFSINGHIRNITYYPTRLTNDQLQAITK